MDSVGFAAAITIIYAVIVNITFTASSILAFPDFYGELEMAPKCCMRCWRRLCRSKRKETEHQDIDQQLIDQQTVTTVSTVNGVDKVTKAIPLEARQATAPGDECSSESSRNMENEPNEHEDAQNCYFRLTQITTRSPWKFLVPLIIYGAMSPVIAVLFTDYQYSMDFTDFFPTDSSSVDTWNQMVGKFPASSLSPYYILAITRRNQSIWSTEYFRSMCHAANLLMDNFDIPSVYFQSAMYAPDVTFSPTFNISMDEILCFDQNVTDNDVTYSMMDAIESLYQTGSVDPQIESSSYYLYVTAYLNGNLESMIRYI